MCCVICVRPPNVVVPKHVLVNCFGNNDQGAGMSFRDSDTGELKIIKGYFDFDTFYEEVMKHPDKEMLMHFRVASPQMVVNRENCHPYGYDSDGLFNIVIGGGEGGDATDEEEVPQFEFAIVHNGRLPIKPTATESDTNVFVNQLLGPHLARDPFFLDSATGRWFLESVIGTKNKMAIMRLNRQTDELATFIINEKEGKWDHGCWFSNHSYNYAPTTVTNYGGGENWEHLQNDEYGPGRRTEPKAYNWAPFLIQDAEGWVWSMKEDKWRNKLTGQVSYHLKNRPSPDPQERHKISKITSMFAKGPSDGDSTDTQDDTDEIIDGQIEMELDQARQDENKRAFNAMLHNLQKEERHALVTAVYTWHAEAYGERARVDFRKALGTLLARIRIALPHLVAEKAIYEWIMTSNAKGLAIEVSLARIMAMKPKGTLPLPALTYTPPAPKKVGDIVIVDADGKATINPVFITGAKTDAPTVVPTATVVSTTPSPGRSNAVSQPPPLPATPITVPRQLTPSETADTARHHLDPLYDGGCCGDC